jgi:predicted PurR-regulated permease PerM
MEPLRHGDGARELTARAQIWIWALALAIALVLLFLAQEVLLPFVVGIAVAYFLDPLADRLEKWGCSRTVATLSMTVAFFALLIAAIVLLFPLLQGQIVGLIGRIPAMVEAVSRFLAPLMEQLRESLSAADVEKIRGAAETYAGTVLSWFGELLKGAWRGGAAVFNTVSLLVVTPLVAFYLLRDWDKIVAAVDRWLPRDHAPEIRGLASDIDKMLAGFVRGQGTVCLFLAAFYGLGLHFAGLEFGLLVGLVTGFISFVPYFGMLIGMVTAIGIAFVQFSDWVPFALVIGVFVAGQVIESFFLTPKLVGEKVGLHPVWVIFALMAGGAAFGFTGVLLAVPVAATVGVVVRFVVSRYLGSELYRGTDGET